MISAVIDRGNSSTKIGLFQDGHLLRTSELDYHNMSNFFAQHPVESSILSSVVPLTNTDLKEFYNISSRSILLTSDTPLPIGLNYHTRTTLGTDRIASAVGSSRYCKGHRLIIDAGTCITYDWVDNNNVFRGGIISLGRAMRAQAMHEFTGLLPRVDLEDTWELIGTSTTECILSGVQEGCIAEARVIIEKMEDRVGDLKVLFTGGDAVFFEKQLEIDSFVVSNLVLEGLDEILSFNGGI